VTATKYNFDAIESCRSAMNTQAGQFGTIGDSFQGAAPGADVFGKLDASVGFASSVGSFTGTVHSELTAAENLLREVEQALDSVESMVKGTDVAGAKGLTPR
jgi:hypothetical protein